MGASPGGTETAPPPTAPTAPNTPTAPHRPTAPLPPTAPRGAALSRAVRQDYLHSLGKGRTAEVQRDARVGEAEAKRDAGIRVRTAPWPHSNPMAP